MGSTIAFFGALPEGLFLILDDAESLQRGKFRRELILLRDLFRAKGWQSAVGSPAEIQRDGRYLLWDGQEVSFLRLGGRFMGLHGATLVTGIGFQTPPQRIIRGAIQMPG